MSASGEERFIARHLAPLTDGLAGAHDLKDDCASLSPLPGHEFVFKTDPVVAGVHFFASDAPEDLAWKALAVNVSDLAAKAARPVAYLLALTLPEPPAPEWMARFAQGLRDAQDAFGCSLIGGDTDVAPGPLSIAVTIIGEVPVGRMVRRGGVCSGDAIYVSGELGGAALGLKLRVEPEFGKDWGLSTDDREQALARYLRPRPKLGLQSTLRHHARSAMDISDGLIKDLDRMCRLGGCGAVIDPALLPLAPGLGPTAGDGSASTRVHCPSPERLALATSGDDYEVLTAVRADAAAEFERAAAAGGVPITRIGSVTATAGVILRDAEGAVIDVESAGFDHFDRSARAKLTDN